MSFFVRTASFGDLGLFLRNCLPGISFKKRKKNLCLQFSHFVSVNLLATFMCYEAVKHL